MSTTVEFWYDFSSPYTYLASTQIEALAKRAGANLVWKPMLLGGVFKLVGMDTIPMAAAGPAKQQYFAHDMRCWSSYWGVPFKFAPSFPVRTVNALRLCLLAEDKMVSLSHALFKATWVDSRDIGDKKVLAEILTEQGFDAASMLEQTQDPAIKQKLIDCTSAAVEAGIFGAPTCVVKHPQGDLLFWGQDRLVLVEKALGGWHPEAG